MPYVSQANFSAADIMMGYTILISEKLAPSAADEFPAAKKYWAMLQKRPACAIALSDLESGPLGKKS